ncbi:MAG: IclR family transcriptional regulator [Actinoallomurus sp.]
MLEQIALDWPDAVASRALIEELGLNRSTCYNILGTLRRAGWVTTQGDRTGWSLGARLFALTGIAGRPLASVVQRELDDLSARLTVFAVERRGTARYTVLAKAERAQGIRITVSVGDTFPFATPAMAHAFHAWADPAEVDRLGLPVRDLDATRVLGYGTGVGEHDPIRSAVAAPIFDARGRASMALCSLAFSSELNDTNIAQVGALLRDHGRRVTARTGGAVPDDRTRRAHAS